MSRRAVILAFVIGLLAGSLLTAGVMRSASSSWLDDIPAQSFRAVTGEGSPVGLLEPEVFAETAHRPPDDRATNPAPSASAVPAVPTERPAKAHAGPPVGGRLVRGTATWYCLGGVSGCTKGHQSGMFAAAGSELRHGNWRGSRVRVCASKCVVVTLIDACWCRGNRIIDLYSQAFSKLAPLGRGVIDVEVYR